MNCIYEILIRQTHESTRVAASIVRRSQYQLYSMRRYDLRRCVGQAFGIVDVNRRQAERRWSRGAVQATLAEDIQQQNHRADVQIAIRHELDEPV